MARISLRSYNREIENLIERGQIEEAIAHSKNILKQYPKHIETYLLLGKAFLESQRYSEASDILQRVLSVVPDDFVAQLGMSIIREDEANLDAAIWHMERAYEVQPFNRAVQDELRRLYGRRDGAEPPRVRLTRGSLVRMYARGELFPQAIAEIRAALAEDPHRLDLMVLLARMYFLAGQKVESAEIASSLISKLPYCMEANRILMDILPGTNRAEEAQGFKRRVYDLDPYTEFITPNTPTSPQVPEQNVMVEHADWRPSAQENQSPDWARTIGVSWGKETEEEALPDWLDSLAPGPTVTDATTPPPAPIQPQSEEMVPDFLRSAGWGLSEPGTEGMNGPVKFEEDSAEPLENTEIPDWLQSMAPARDTTSQEPEPEKLDWLNAILPAAAISLAVDEASKEKPPAQENQPEDISLDWLMPEEETKPDLSSLTWLDATVSNESDNSSEAIVESDAQPAENPVPDWLRELGSMTSADQTTPAEGTGDLPAWLRETSMQPEPASQEPIDWLQETEQTENPKSTNELPAWMQEEAAGPSSTENLPDWLKEEFIPSETSLDAFVVETAEISAGGIPATNESTDVDLDAGLSQLDSSETETPPSADAAAVDLVENQFKAVEEQVEIIPETTPITSAVKDITLPGQTADETPNWLREDIAESSFTASVEPHEKAETEQLDQLTDWPNLMDQDNKSVIPAAFVAGLTADNQTVEDTQPVKIKHTEEAPAVPPEKPAKISTQTPGKMTEPDFNDMDATMAWLEALAAKQGAESESLKITRPEQRSETLPGWIAEISSQQPAAVVEEPVLDEDIPDWLKDDRLDTGEQAPITPTTENRDDWVSEFPSAFDALQPNDPSAPSEESSDMPEVISESENRPGEVGEESPVSDLPAWSIEGQTAPKSEMPMISTQASAGMPNLDDMDSTMAWLEALAAKQGADQESLKITSPEQRSITPPDWIAELSKQSGDTSTGREKEIELPAPVEEIPVQPEALPSLEASVQIGSEPAVTESPASEPDTPAWLLNYEQEQAVAKTGWETIGGDPAAPTQSTKDEDSITQWLKTHHPEPGMEPVETPEPLKPEPVQQTSQASEQDNPLGAQAQAALVQGEIGQSMSIYTQIIQTGSGLDMVIKNLHNAADLYPMDANIWQTLGDAYIRADQVQEALDAYTKAEELLR